jgi:hypothetical protein
VLVSRFHSGSELGRGMRQAAAESCSALGDPAGCSDHPFVYPSSYQYAGWMAYYAGWTRFGPAAERPSQLDLWDDRPRAGEPFLFAGQDIGIGKNFRDHVRFEQEGPQRAFEVRWHGQLLRRGNVTAFGRYLEGQVYPPPRPLTYGL